MPFLLCLTSHLLGSAATCRSKVMAACLSYTDYSSVSALKACLRQGMLGTTVGTYQLCVHPCSNLNHKDPEPITSYSLFSPGLAILRNILPNPSEDSRTKQWEAPFAQSHDKLKKIHPRIFFLLPSVFPEIICQNKLHKPLSHVQHSQGIQGKKK